MSIIAESRMFLKRLIGCQYFSVIRPLVSQAYSLRQQRLHVREQLLQVCTNRWQSYIGILFVGWLKINGKGYKLWTKQGLVKIFFIKLNYFFQLFFVSLCIAAFSRTCSSNVYILKSSWSKRSSMQLITLSKASK